MRSIWIGIALVACLATPARAQLSSGGATQDTDDGSIAGSQLSGLALGLTQAWDGSVWRRVTFGTAGTAATQVWTVQGIASMTPLLVDGSAATQPVSGTVTVTDGAGALNVIIDSGTLTAVTTVTNAVTVTATNLDVQSGGADLATEATLANALTSANFAAAFGTAGTADTQVISVQGIASMTPVQVSQATASNLNATVSATNLDVQIGGSDSLTIGTFPDNEPFNHAQVSGTAVSVNNGASDAGTQRVTLANDSTGEVRVADDAGNQIPSSTAAPAETARGLNVRPVHDDPCKTGLATPLPLSLTTDTEVVAAVASQHVYVCQFQVFVAAANNVAVISGTGTTCATSTAGVMGGATAATGWNFIANQGIVVGTGDRMVARTETAGDALCIDVSAASQTSGSLTYVQQ